jgi:dihydrofolate reductase
VKAIVAVDKNWGIGCNGELLERIPEDMKFFKAMTTGKIVVMGRETLESLPGKKPLKDRTNIVLSRTMKPGKGPDDGQDESSKGMILCSSIDELLAELKKYPSEDVFVIGGASVYRQLLPYCSEIYVTKFPNGHTADAYYPNLDEQPEWDARVMDDRLEHNGFAYSRYVYVRKQDK